MVAEETEGWEVVRFWIGGGYDYVSLHLPCDEAGKLQIETWGNMAADIVTHAMRALRQDDPSLDEREILARIVRAFQDRLGKELGGSGQLSGKIQ